MVIAKFGKKHGVYTPCFFLATNKFIISRLIFAMILSIYWPVVFPIGFVLFLGYLLKLLFPQPFAVLIFPMFYFSLSHWFILICNGILSLSVIFNFYFFHGVFLS